MATNPLSQRLQQSAQVAQNYKAQLDALKTKQDMIAQKQAVINSIANPADPLKIRLQNELAALNPSYVNSQYNIINQLYQTALAQQQGSQGAFENYEAGAQNYYNQQAPVTQNDYAMKLGLMQAVWQPANIQPANPNRVTLPEWLGTRYANTVGSLEQDAIQAEQMWNTQLASDLRTQANFLKSQGKKANEVQQTFFNLGTTLDNFYAQYANQMSNTEADLLGKIKWMKDIVESQYWPEWTQTKRLEENYGKLRWAVQNRLTTTQAGALGESTKTGTWSVGAGMIMNEADRKAQEENANIWINEAAAYDALYKAYDQYLNNFIQQYGNVKDKFTVDTLQKLLAYKTTLSTQAQEALRGAIEQKYALSAWNTSNNTRMQAVWDYYYSKTKSAEETKNYMLQKFWYNRVPSWWYTVPVNTWTNYTTTGNIPPVTQ